MVEPTPECFFATAQAFKDGQLSFEHFIDINLRHFSGERHLEDAVDTDENLGRLSWLGNMGRVSAAMKICILEPGFVAPPVELLRPILLACPSATFQALTSLDNSMKSQSGISVFSNSFLLQIAILIAIYYENNTLAKALADIGPPPPRCIFHCELGSIRREYTPPHAIDREVLAHLIRHGWAIPDRKAVFYAVESPDALSGIDLFRAIASSGFDLTNPIYATALPQLAASSGEPQMLQHILSHFSIPRPNDDLILMAVSARKSGGADMLRYLMNQGISVDYTKASSVNYMNASNAPRHGWGWGWSPTAGCGGYGDPRARAEAEYAQGTSGYSVVSDTALHLAAQNGNVDAVRVLLDRGARKNVRDAAGRTPFQRAQHANKEEVLDMLRE